MVGVGDRHILSVDWDPRELRVVHARIRRGQVRVEDVFAVSMPKDVDLADGEAVGRVLGDALQQEGISCRRVIADIPRDQAVLNTLHLPKVSVNDLAGMVAVQIGKSLPFPVSEAVIDFAIPLDEGEQGLRTDREGPQEVVVGAVRAEVLEYYRKVCHTAGLKLERLGLRPYANRVAVTQFLAGEPPERVLVVDVGPLRTEIDVLRRGQLAFSRAAEVFVPEERSAIQPISAGIRPKVVEAAGGDDEIAFLPAEEAFEPRLRDTTVVVTDLMVEVTRSIEAYRTSDPGAEMDCAVVAGGTGIEETLAEAIQRRFGINAETYNPASCLGGDAQRAAGASGFSAALGLVLGHASEGRLQFNFLHPKRQEMPGQARLRKAPLAAAVAALFAVAAGAWYVQGPARRFAEVERLEEAVQKAKAEIKANQDFVNMVEDAKRFEDEQVIWVDELVNVMTLLPDNTKVVVDKLDMTQGEKDKRLVLDLRAADGGQEADIVERFAQFRRDEAGRPHYSATRGSTAMTKGSYPHEGIIRVEIDQAPEQK